MGKEKKLRKATMRVEHFARVCHHLGLFNWNEHPPGHTWAAYGYISDIQGLFLKLYRGKIAEKLAAADEIERRQLWWFINDEL